MLDVELLSMIFMTSRLYDLQLNELTMLILIQETIDISNGKPY